MAISVIQVVDTAPESITVEEASTMVITVVDTAPSTVTVID